MTGFEWMEKELDQFHEDNERPRNMKLLIDFNSLDMNYSAPSFELGKPKMKKKLTANKWIPNKRGNSLF